MLYTPNLDVWDPYSTHWSSNEASMVHYKGGLTEQKYWKHHLLPEEADSFEPVSISRVKRCIKEDTTFHSTPKIRTCTFPMLSIPTFVE